MFTVSPTTFDVGVLDAGEVVDIPVTFSGVDAAVSGQGTVTFDLSDGSQATVTLAITKGAATVTQGPIVVDPALTGVTVTVLNLTNAGATIRVARA